MKNVIRIGKSILPTIMGCVSKTYNPADMFEYDKKVACSKLEEEKRTFIKLCETHIIPYRMKVIDSNKIRA